MQATISFNEELHYENPIFFQRIQCEQANPSDSKCSSANSGSLQDPNGQQDLSAEACVKLEAQQGCSISSLRCFVTCIVFLIVCIFFYHVLRCADVPCHFLEFQIVPPKRSVKLSGRAKIPIPPGCWWISPSSTQKSRGTWLEVLQHVIQLLDGQMLASRKNPRRGEPGQLPWDTVKQGSLILIGTWCAWTAIGKESAKCSPMVASTVDRRNPAPVEQKWVRFSIL